MSWMIRGESYLIRDSRENTSEPVYEHYRLRQFEGKTRSKLVSILLSVILSLSVLCSIALLQYDEYVAYINKRIGYINETKAFCKRLIFTNIDTISTPIAGLLVVLYVLIYKRRVFLRNEFKYRNVGLPMMVSCWNKSDRLFSAFTYGLIAFNVFGIVKSSLDGTNNLISIWNVNDPTGLLDLLYKIVQMFLVGIRYYPVLVAYRANTFIINITCVIYLWIDFVENIYQYGKCESISSESDNVTNETTRRLPYYITYKVLSAVPLSIFSSFIIITLTYKSAINLIDFILRYRSPSTRKILEEKSRDTIFCMIANVDDDHEIIYSKYDFDYVLELLENKSASKTSKNDSSKSISKQSIKSLKYIEVKRYRNTPFYKILKYFIYRPDRKFRFTSRYVNTITVALVALYYVFIYWTYFISMNISQLVAIIPEKPLKSNDVGRLWCSYSPTTCSQKVLDLKKSDPISIIEEVFQFLSYLRTSLLAVFITPLFGSFVICVIQVFLLMRETKEHLIELYKGKCEFVRKASSLGKNAIASSSFHFGGYMVGYLIWGYFIIYLTGLIIGIVILLLRIFVGEAIFWDITLRLVPTMCVLAVKYAINIVASNYWFLQSNSKILALNNFRAYNVFVYFNFYLDCFMGIISAVIRLFKSFCIAIFMMPRISYSFMGRHFERQDAGYSSYSGFLHMEAMHTNPILICFCSLLYYKDLSEHLRRYKIQRRAVLSSLEFDATNTKIYLSRFTGRLYEPNSPSSFHRTPTKNYKTRVVIRWHLYLRLTLNKEIIKYRKVHVTKHEKKRPIGFIEIFRNEIFGLSYNKKPKENENAHF